MPVVWIPSLMRDLTQGVEQVVVPGATVRQVITNLDQIHPGFRARLLKDEQLVPHVAVIIDGQESHLGLSEHVTEDSEIFFLPAMSGGQLRRIRRHEQ